MSTSNAVTRMAKSLKVFRPDFTLTNARTFASALAAAPDGVFGESPLSWLPGLSPEAARSAHIPGGPGTPGVALVSAATEAGFRGIETLSPDGCVGVESPDQAKYMPMLRDGRGNVVDTEGIPHRVSDLLAGADTSPGLSLTRISSEDLRSGDVVLLGDGTQLLCLDPAAGMFVAADGSISDVKVGDGFGGTRDVLAYRFEDSGEAEQGTQAGDSSASRLALPDLDRLVTPKVGAEASSGYHPGNLPTVGSSTTGDSIPVCLDSERTDPPHAGPPDSPEGVPSVGDGRMSMSHRVTVTVPGSYSTQVTFPPVVDGEPGNLLMVGRDDHGVAMFRTFLPALSAAGWRVFVLDEAVNLVGVENLPGVSAVSRPNAVTGGSVFADTVSIVLNMLNQRMSARANGQEGDKYPIVLAVSGMRALRRRMCDRADDVEIARRIDKIIQYGPRFGVFVLASTDSDRSLSYSKAEFHGAIRFIEGRIDMPAADFRGGGEPGFPSMGLFEESSQQTPVDLLDVSGIPAYVHAPASGEIPGVPIPWEDLAIPLGVNAAGNAVSYRPSVHPVASVVGSSGSGVTTTLTTIIEGARAAGWDVAVMSYRGELSSVYRDAPQVVLAGDVGVLSERLPALLESRGSDSPPMLLVADDFPRWNPDEQQQFNRITLAANTDTLAYVVVDKPRIDAQGTLNVLLGRAVSQLAGASAPADLKRAAVSMSTIRPPRRGLGVVLDLRKQTAELCQVMMTDVTTRG